VFHTNWKFLGSVRDNSLSPTKGLGPFSRDVKSDYYPSFDQARTTANNLRPINDNGIAFGSPYSFAQTTLPQGSVFNMFAPNTTADQNGFTSLDIDASFQLSELG
jgi:hypothetical protein